MCHLPDLLLTPLKEKASSCNHFYLWRTFLYVVKTEREKGETKDLADPHSEPSVGSGKVCIPCPVHAHSLTVGSFPAHFSASEAVSQRGEKCLRIKIKITSQGYMKMALQIHMKFPERECNMWSAFEWPEGMGNGGLF